MFLLRIISQVGKNTWRRRKASWKYLKSWHCAHCGLVPCTWATLSCILYFVLKSSPLVGKAPLDPVLETLLRFQHLQLEILHYFLVFVSFISYLVLEIFFCGFIIITACIMLTVFHKRINSFNSI